MLLSIYYVYIYYYEHMSFLNGKKVPQARCIINYYNYPDFYYIQRITTTTILVIGLVPIIMKIKKCSSVSF